MDPDEMDANLADQCAVERIRMMSTEQLIDESGKLVFAVKLLDNLKAEGHRCLVFSARRRMLDILQRILNSRVRT